MKYFKQESLVPPGGWFYVHADSGRKITANSFPILKSRVRTFLGANNYPIPVGLNELITNQVCERAPEYCMDMEPPSATQMIGNFAKAASGWVKAGFKVVSSEVYEQRLAACKQCQFFSGRTSIGHAACKKCGCNGLKLFWASEQCPLSEPKWGRA